MKNLLGKLALVVWGGSVLGLAIVSDVKAQANTFACGVSRGVPATVANTREGEVPVIRWTSNHFSGSGWTPERRCAEVSQRFQTFQSQGQLNFLTTGILNGQKVICTSSRGGGSCEGLILTVKSHDNADAVLRDLLEVQSQARGPLDQSSGSEQAIQQIGGRTFVNMKAYIRNSVAQPSTSTSVPETIKPVKPANPSGGKSNLW